MVITLVIVLTVWMLISIFFTFFVWPSLVDRFDEDYPNTLERDT